MSKDLKKIGNLFIFQIIVILFVSLLSIILIFSFNVTSVISKLSLNAIDHTAKAVAEHMRLEKKLPVISDDYQAFVIDQKEGFFIYDRHEKSYKDKVLWESYRTKLIYEMQKQKNGWVFYPDENSRSFTADYKVLRYISIDELGWIVVVEGTVQSRLSILKEILSNMTVAGFFLIFLFASGFIIILAKRHHIKVKKNLAEYLENGILDIKHESFFKGSTAGNKTFDQDLTPLSEKADKSFLKDKGDIILDGPSEVVNKTGKATKPNDTIDLSKKPVLEEKKKKIKKIQDQNDKNDSPLDDITIELQGIESPLLKKMIKELRER